ncbi:SpoIIE family protein phosphatase [Streptomyces sp. NPDC006208]|uniref:SpoIIE family protein phosphatase n=1 Tax=Streptomyces sp. NPDC006208 TaxID=3156734 RepID=UPI0033A260F1
MAQGGSAVPAGDAEAALLDALFTQSPVGLHVLDTDLRVVRINTATQGMQGVHAEALIGRHFADAYGVAEPEETEALLRGVLATGIPVRERIVRARHPITQVEHYYAVSVFRLQDSRETILGVALAVVDVTEREKARARVRVLGAVRERVGRTLDVVVASEELVRALVPEFADVAIVEVVDAVVRGDDPPLSPLPRGTPLRRAGFRSADPHLPQTHPVGDVRSLPDPTPFTQALSDLRPRVLAVHPGLPWLAADPDRAKVIRASGAQSLLIAPLTLRGTVLGLISLYRTRQTEPYDDDDLDFALQLAEHTALCIDNARRYTREHTVASTVQRQLLPRRPAAHTALETAYVSTPSDGAGAWYDTISLSSARTALVVGEVAGQGIHTTAAMGQLRTVIRSLAGFDLESDELLARLNDTAAQLAAERASLPPGDPLHREALTASCVYAVYDPLTRTCTVASAGHLAPVVVHPDGSTVIPDVPTGPTLGNVGGTPFATTQFEIPDGSVLAFSSSPVLTQYLAGRSGLLHGASAGDGRPLQDVCDDILYSLPNGIGVHATALLLARTHPFPADRVASWPLDADPAAVAVARHHVCAQLTAWDVDDETAFNTELMVSELVTNAIRYGSPPLELRLINDRGLTCEVRDTSPAMPRLRHARTVDEGGRGLFIVAQLAHAWGTRYTAEGKTIWAEQVLPALSGAAVRSA